MEDPFVHITQKIQSADRLPVLLSAAFVGLELADLTAQTLTEQTPAGSFPAYVTARFEAAEARDALSRAPSLTRPSASPPAARATTQDIAASVATLAKVLTRALIVAAEATTDPADKIACLDAALHVGRLHEALR